MLKKENQQAWRKVSDLRQGMKIAVPDGNEGIFWDEIASIKPVGREQVYDIEVEGTHNFVGNDIFAHNTYIGVADVVAEDASGRFKQATIADSPAAVAVELASGAGKFAINGRVQVKVSEENGQIHAGDRLVVSKILPGYATKMTESGQSIGIALENSAGSYNMNHVSGLGTILVFVNLGYQHIDVAVNTAGDKIIYDKDIGMSGQSFLNVKAIASMSGKWAVGEDGTITAVKLCLEEICIDKNQLKALLEKNGLLPNVIAPASDPTTPAIDTPPASEPDLTPAPDASVTPDTTAPDATVTPPIDAPADAPAVDAVPVTP